MNPPSSSPQPAPGGPQFVYTQPAPYTPRQQPKRTLRDYWNMYRERGHWGLLAALVAGGVVGWLLMRNPALYRAHATIEIQSPVPTVATAGGALPVLVSSEVNLPYHLERLRSANFRTYAIHLLTPQESDKIRQVYLNPDLPPSEQVSVDQLLADGVGCSERTGAPIIEIAAYHRDPAAAALIANHYARSYIDYVREQTSGGSTASAMQLNDEEGRLRHQLEEAQGRLQAFRQQADVGALSDRQASLKLRLETVTRQLGDARGETTQLESTLTQVDGLMKAGRSMLESSYVSSYGSVAVLMRDIDQLKAERAILEERYLDQHPKMLANTRAIEAKTSLLAENINRAVTELRNNLERSRAHEKLLLDQQASLGTESRDVEQNVLTFDVLKKEVADIITRLYDEIPKQRKELATAAALSSPTVKLLDSAAAPGLPYRPDMRMVYATAGGTGLAFLLIVPLVVGMVDVRLKAAWEVEQFLGQNLLGEVPALTGISKTERPHLMAKKVDHTASEAFRGLFGQLQLNSTVPYPKLVMITSTIPGEGKSMVANNLAATFAAHGKKTLLIDCDLRRPNLHIYYGRDNGYGLLRWMAGEQPLAPNAEDDGDLGILPVKPNLYLLRSGGEDRQATEIYEMPRFGELLEGLRQQFDIILVDTPPLGIFPDGLLVSRNCAEVIYVCRFNAVHRSKVRKTLERLNRSNAVLAGIILNGIPTGKQSAYYDYYGYGTNENKRYKAYYSQKR